MEDLIDARTGFSCADEGGDASCGMGVGSGAGGSGPGVGEGVVGAGDIVGGGGDPGACPRISPLGFSAE
jgi:hypothetical protein